MIDYYIHQIEGSNELLLYKKYCLFFGIGVGKTLTALRALSSLKNKKILIVAPSRILKSIWIQQKDIDVSKFDIEYMSYEAISRDYEITKKTYDVIILDEVHKIKSGTSKCSKRIRKLSEKAEYVWGLTGTPYANSYCDIYWIFRNMDIKEFDMSYNDFVFWYYNSYNIQTSLGHTISIPSSVKPNRLPELLDKIGRHSFTKTLNFGIEEPEINEYFLEGMNTDYYKKVENGILEINEDTKLMTKLESVNKAHQVANGYVYDSINNIILNIKDNSAKINKLLDILKSITDRVIIVYHYKKDLSTLTNLIKEDYTTNFEEFKNNKILFLQSGQCEGLNLQDYCSHVIFYTYDYSFLKFEQMVGRVYRNRQKNKVIVDVLINNKTIENNIWKAVKNKQTTDEFLKGVLER